MEDLATQKNVRHNPERAKVFDHFVVGKRRAKGRVILADPGFGNMTMKVDRFQKLWKNGVMLSSSTRRKA